MCFYIFFIGCSFTCHLPYCLGYQGRSVEYSWFSLGNSNWLFTVLPTQFFSHCENLNTPYFFIEHLNSPCFCSVKTWISPSVIHFLVAQILAACVAFLEIHGTVNGMSSWRNTFLREIHSSIVHIGNLSSASPSKNSVLLVISNPFGLIFFFLFCKVLVFVYCAAYCCLLCSWLWASATCLGLRSPFSCAAASD